MSRDKLEVFQTESIDKLYLELSQFTQAKTKRDLQLEQLLYSVRRKFPGESRFDTALRYIREAESKHSISSESLMP